MRDAVATQDDVIYTSQKRDNTNKLYLLVYTINKEEFEFDLINKAKELDVESKYLLNFYNKYSKYNNNQK